MFKKKTVLTVEAELSDWLIDATARGVNRKTAEKLFENNDVVAYVVQGKFTKIRGLEANINKVEDDLMTHIKNADQAVSSQLPSSDAAMMYDHASDIPVEKMHQQQQLSDQKVALSAAQESRKLDDTSDIESSAISTAETVKHRVFPEEKVKLRGTDVQDRTTCESFEDEMDVEKSLWQYMLFKHAKTMGDLTSECGCDFGLRRSAVDANGTPQYRLKVTAPTKAGLSPACETLAEMIVKLTEANVTRRKVELCPTEYFDELKDELSKRDIVLMLSSCYVVGPAGALDAAQSVINAAVKEIYARKSPLVRDLRPDRRPVELPSRDVFQFHIPSVGLTVHISQGLQRLLLN